jgi:hypothetical protein
MVFIRLFVGRIRLSTDILILSADTIRIFSSTIRKPTDKSQLAENKNSGFLPKKRFHSIFSEKSPGFSFPFFGNYGFPRIFDCIDQFSAQRVLSTKGHFFAYVSTPLHS